MRPLIWICLVAYALVMAGVSFAAHRIVGSFGVVGSLLTIAAMLAAAAYLDRRSRSLQDEPSPRGPSRMRNQDYYAVLGVAKEADPEVIKAAYRALAKKHHPDSPSGSAERFRQISSAWEVLSDPKLRKVHDAAIGGGAAENPDQDRSAAEKSPDTDARYAGVGGVVLLILLVFGIAAFLSPTTPKPEAVSASSALLPSARDDQQIQRNGLTKATNDFLREMSNGSVASPSKKPR
jgi:hypothetical protein